MPMFGADFSHCLGNLISGWVWLESEMLPMMANCNPVWSLEDENLTELQLGHVYVKLKD